jgi:subtilisin family serine protease
MSGPLKARWAAVTVGSLLVAALVVPAELTLAAESDPEASVDSTDAASPKDAEFYNRQWNLKAIHAHPAFSAYAAFGSKDVRVAIVDTGIDYLHPDLHGLVNLELSTSLIAEAEEGSTCEGEPGIPYRSDHTKDLIDEIAAADTRHRDHVTDFHSHGTAVAGLIASNARYLAGVTQRTTLFGVKVHGMGRQNCLSVYLDGIRKAADRGADVIHLSIPLEIDELDTEAVNAVDAAIEYAHERGAVLVAAAGNNTPPKDLDQGALLRFCEPEPVICVSATGPASAELVDEQHWDAIAPYSNYGSVIDVAGPGGTAAVPVWLTCSMVTEFRGPAQAPCYARKPVWQSTGTSFGAAATSGLAALVASLIDDATPERIEDIIKQSADDRGTVGPDDYYGSGRINVKKAVALARS